MFDVRFSCFIISCSTHTHIEKTTLRFSDKYLRKAETKLLQIKTEMFVCTYLWEVAQPGRSSARSCPHTPSPSKSRPSRSVTPCGGKIYSESCDLHENSYYAAPAFFFYTNQTTVPSPEPKSRRDWGAKEGSLFFIWKDKKEKTDI